MRFLSPDKLEWLKKLKARDISGVVVFGDVHGNITQETVESLTLRWDTVRTSQHELAWLNWRTRLSDFVGRNDVKTEVIDWAKQAGAGVLARFVTGEGGVGKTRLAAEVADELRKEGWATAQILSGVRKFKQDSRKTARSATTMSGRKTCFFLMIRRHRRYFSTGPW